MSSRPKKEFGGEGGGVGFGDEYASVQGWEGNFNNVIRYND